MLFLLQLSLTQYPHAYPTSSLHAESNFFLNAITVREMTIKQWHLPHRPAAHVSDLSAYLTEMSSYCCKQLRDNIVVEKVS